MKSPGITPHAGSASVWHSLVATHCDRLTELPDHSTIAHQSLPIIARNYESVIRGLLTGLDERAAMLCLVTAGRPEWRQFPLFLLAGSDSMGPESEMLNHKLWG